MRDKVGRATMSFAKIKIFTKVLGFIRKLQNMLKTTKIDFQFIDRNNNLDKDKYMILNSSYFCF